MNIKRLGICIFLSGLAAVVTAIIAALVAGFLGIRDGVVADVSEITFICTIPIGTTIMYFLNLEKTGD
jgi:putative N-acetylmannosamine-6-phosphate epimerase